MYLILNLVEVTVNLCKQAAEIKALGLIGELGCINLNKVRTAYDILKLTESHLSQKFPYALSHEHIVVDKVLAVTAELGPQSRILCSNTYRAGVGMALTHKQASQNNQLACSESELAGTQQSH